MGTGWRQFTGLPHLDGFESRLPQGEKAEQGKGVETTGLDRIKEQPVCALAGGSSQDCRI